MRSGAITSAMLLAGGMVAAANLPGAAADEPGFARRARQAARLPGEPAMAAPRESDDERLYLAGMLGVGDPGGAARTSAPDSPLLAGTLFGGDSALGITSSRPWGATRAECEVRGRTAAQPGTGERWSLMANVWHDVGISDRVSVYGGGGAGPGGTRPADGAKPPPAGLAWQIGAGVSYDLGERLTLDVGYRYGGVENGAARGRAPAASEGVIAVRIHDPFRGWWERRGATSRPEAATVRPAGG